MAPRLEQVGTYNPIMRRLYCSDVLFALGSKELYLHQLGLRTAMNQACLTAAGISWPELWRSLRLRKKSVLVSDMALPAQWNSSTSRTLIAICMRKMVTSRVNNIKSSIYDLPWEIDAPDSVVFWTINSPQVLVADAGEYCLVFDNSYSWFKSKQIYYWYHVATNQHVHNMFNLKTTGTLCSFFCPCILRLSVGCVC